MASRAASSAGWTRARAPGSATCSSTSRSSCRTSPARRSPSARRAATASPASTTSSTSTSSREVGLEAGQLALHLLEFAAAARAAPAEDYDDFDFERRRDRFIRFAQSKALGPSTASLVAAAEKRDIPWLRLNGQSLIQFGHGRFQQRIQATITSATPHIAVELASDKEETCKLLGDLGLPVPKQRMVYDAEEAATAARRIGQRPRMFD